MIRFCPQEHCFLRALFCEDYMRIDKYLKVSRIIKRRTVASDACSGGRVFINQKIAKPSSDVKPGDIIYAGLSCQEVFPYCFDFRS